MTGDLFGDPPVASGPVALRPGAAFLPGFALREAADAVAAMAALAAAAPFRHMSTRRGGRLSVAMTSCGEVGWTSDRRGYRYVELDPETGRPWPAMPALFVDLAGRAAAAAGHPGFRPDTCLVNRYEPGARMGLHQDRDEALHAAPIVSLSFGLPAVFLFGGDDRGDPAEALALRHGDAVVWGGPARLAWHGVRPLGDGHHPATGRRRFNLTFRLAR